METQFRVIPQGVPGKWHYFDTLEEIGNLFTTDEIRDSHIAVIFGGAVVLGQINADLLANEIIYLESFK